MHQQKSFNKPINHLKSTHLSRMSSKCTRFSEYSNSILLWIPNRLNCSSERRTLCNK